MQNSGNAFDLCRGVVGCGALPRFRGMPRRSRGRERRSGRSANGVTIYVSKKNKTVTLKQYSNIIGTYQASIGRNSSSGDKAMEGDARTPSGSYYVCTRNDKSSYYLALGVSYPSAEDAEKGYEDGIITEEERDAIVRRTAKGSSRRGTRLLAGRLRSMAAGAMDRGPLAALQWTMM